MSIGIGVILGLLGYSFAEYWVHRAGHVKRLGYAVAKHNIHHAAPSTFPGVQLKFGLPLAAGAAALVGWGFGREASVSFLATGLAGWSLFEIVHRRLHRKGPRTAYGRWVARYHLYHHFVRPNSNHGITSPLWDLLLGTYERPVPMTVPPKHARSSPWLRDPASLHPSLGRVFLPHHRTVASRR